MKIRRTLAQLFANNYQKALKATFLRSIKINVLQYQYVEFLE